MAVQKNIIDRYQSITNGNMTTSLTSSVSDIRYLDNIGIQIKWTSASAIGVFTIECSNNYNPVTNTVGTWFSVTPSPAVTNPASNNGEFGTTIVGCPHAYLRVVYTVTSGTGTLNVWVTAKET